MQPDRRHLTLRNNRAQIRDMLMELVLLPRQRLAKWAGVTKQTANIKLGYVAQHLASLVTGVEGTRTGARGHDLRDRSEVKSCSRVDQLDACQKCKGAVSRGESLCPVCGSSAIRRKNDSKWLLAVKSREELSYLLTEVPRIVFILGDYPGFDRQDWHTLRFQVFEIWPGHERHRRFGELMERYFDRIYLPHIEAARTRTPAPKNLWPYSFQFFMCNPVRVLHCLATGADREPQIEIRSYVEPSVDRGTIRPMPMPWSLLNESERNLLEEKGLTPSDPGSGLDEHQRLQLPLRESDLATAQDRAYRRGER